jgi:UPF0716 family protein affecting phage T7 exclusion
MVVQSEIGLFESLRRLQLIVHSVEILQVIKKLNPFGVFLLIFFFFFLFFLGLFFLHVQQV